MWESRGTWHQLSTFCRLQVFSDSTRKVWTFGKAYIVVVSCQSSSSPSSSTLGQSGRQGLSGRVVGPLHSSSRYISGVLDVLFLASSAQLEMIKRYKQTDRPFKEFKEVIIFRDKQTLYRNINIIIFSKLTTYHLRVLGSLKYFGGQTRGVGLRNISARKVKFKFFLSAPTRTWHEEGYWNSGLHTWLCLFAMYTHNHSQNVKNIIKLRLTEKCIVHAARKINWWKYRRHAQCAHGLSEAIKIECGTECDRLSHLNGQWPLTITLFKIKWI